MTTPITGAGSQYSVTPEEIQAAAVSANSTAGNLTDQLSSLQQYVQSLEDQWKGIAAGTFSALMADYGIYSQMLTQALYDIGSGLQGNFVNYTQSEQQNISNLQKVDGSIPGANFS
jgi:WXG100 family type VII secretion target